MRNATGLTPLQIRAIRKGIKLTQAEAAKRIGITATQWCMYENGRRRPSGPAAILIQMMEQGKV